MPTCSLDESISISSCFYRNIYRFWCSSSLLTVNLAAFAAGAPYRARPWYTSSEGRAGRIPVSTETPLRAWLPDRSERQFSVPRGIRVQFLHELVAPIRHDLSTSPMRSHSTRKAREQSSARKAPHFHASRCLQRHNHSYENTPTGCFHAGEGAGTPAWTMEW